MATMNAFPHQFAASTVQQSMDMNMSCTSNASTMPAQPLGPYLRPILLPSPPVNTQKQFSTAPKYNAFTDDSTTTTTQTTWLPSISTVLPQKSFGYQYSTPSTSEYCTFSPHNGSLTPLNQPLYVDTNWHYESFMPHYDPHQNSNNNYSGSLLSSISVSKPNIMQNHEMDQGFWSSSSS